MTTPAAIKAKITRQRKSALMTQFLRDYEKFTGKRVTPDLIRSQQWIGARDLYVKLFMGLMDGVK